MEKKQIEYQFLGLNQLCFVSYHFPGNYCLHASDCPTQSLSCFFTHQSSFFWWLFWFIKPPPPLPPPPPYLPHPCRRLHSRRWEMWWLCFLRLWCSIALCLLFVDSLRLFLFFQVSTFLATSGNPEASGSLTLFNKNFSYHFWLRIRSLGVELS